MAKLTQLHLFLIMLLFILTQKNNAHGSNTEILEMPQPCFGSMVKNTDPTLQTNYHYRLSPTLYERILACKPEQKADSDIFSFSNLIDLSPYPFVTIDPYGTNFKEDAIYIEEIQEETFNELDEKGVCIKKRKHSNDNEKIYFVAIAIPQFQLAPGAALDQNTFHTLDTSLLMKATKKASLGFHTAIPRNSYLFCSIMQHNPMNATAPLLKRKFVFNAFISCVAAISFSSRTRFSISTIPEHTYTISSHTNAKRNHVLHLLQEHGRSNNMGSIMEQHIGTAKRIAHTLFQRNELIIPARIFQLINTESKIRLKSPYTQRIISELCNLDNSQYQHISHKIEATMSFGPKESLKRKHKEFYK